MKLLTSKDFDYSQVESLIKTVWFQTRPQVIQEMILDYPPNVLYKFDTGHVVHLYSYCEDGTVTVLHLGYGTKMAYLRKDIRVFGVKPASLIPFTPEESARIMNEINSPKKATNYGKTAEA